MKKLIYLFILALGFASCEKEPEPPVAKGKFDPNAMIILKGAVSTTPKSSAQKSKIYGLTPLEIVERAVNIKFTSNWFNGQYYEEPRYLSRTFIDEHKDYEMPALKMWATDIISHDGVLNKSFILGRDFYITDENNDSIANLPDEIVNNAYPIVVELFNDSNYTDTYKLFMDTFKFYPLENK